MPRADSRWSSFYLTIPTVLLNRVRIEAAADHRSMAQWVQVLIARHFEAKDKECETSSSVSSSGIQDSHFASSLPVSNPTTGTKGTGCEHPNHPIFPDTCLFPKGGQ